MGRKDGHAGVIHNQVNLVDLRGHTPPNMWSKGGIPKTLLRRGPVNTNNVPKKKKVRVLGKVCGHLASVSELNLGQSGARAGACRGRVWSIPPFDQKIRRYTPV